MADLIKAHARRTLGKVGIRNAFSQRAQVLKLMSIGFDPQENLELGEAAYHRAITWAHENGLVVITYDGNPGWPRGTMWSDPLLAFKLTQLGEEVAGAIFDVQSPHEPEDAT